jgi:hypothetical protein
MLPQNDQTKNNIAIVQNFFVENDYLNGKICHILNIRKYFSLEDNCKRGSKNKKTG